MSKEFKALQNQISELKSRLIEVEAEIKELKKENKNKSTKKREIRIYEKTWQPTIDQTTTPPKKK